MTVLPLPVLAKIDRDQYERFVQLLSLHYVYPLPYAISGAYFEDLFAMVVAGTRESRKLLFDVFKGATGWSLKTKVEGRPSLGSSFTVVLKRSDILKDRSLSLDSTAQELGDRVILDLTRFYSESSEQQRVSDPRIAFLVRNSQEREFFLFQQRYRLYEPSQIRWKWATADKKSITGHLGDVPVLSWYRSGTQTFGIYQIPHDAHHFRITWKRAELDTTVVFFERMGLVRIELDN